MRQDIIDMAREAGLHIATDVNWMPIIGGEYAEKFVKIVEQRKCQELADKIAAMPFGDTAASFAIWIREQS